VQSERQLGYLAIHLMTGQLRDRQRELPLSIQSILAKIIAAGHLPNSSVNQALEGGDLASRAPGRGRRLTTIIFESLFATRTSS
jgi:hypothetical protein